MLLLAAPLHVCWRGCLSLSLSGILTLSHDALDEHNHLVLFNQAVPVLVHSVESLIELRVVVVVGRGNILHDSLEEDFGLLTVQIVAPVRVKLVPDLLDCILVDTIAFDVFRQSVGECFVLSEERIIDENLNVGWEALPDD